MLRLLLLLVLLTDRTRTALVTNPPTFADRLDKLYEKLERLTLSPIKKPSERLYEKLDRLNSLMPDKEFSDDDDEELLSAMQLWVPNMTDEQWQDVVQELQNMKTEKSEKNIDDDDVDDYSEDEDSSDDYVNDVVEELDAFEDEPTTSKAALVVTPSAFTRLDAYRHTIISAVASIAATKERPRILDDSNATTEERKSIRQAALSRMGTVVKSAKCLTPQPRWLSVRKLAPAADTMYMPPCVQLHRCAPDSGCCYNEEEVCAPVEGKNVAIPFLLNKADGKLIPARMMFFNHTRCECVSRETLETTSRAPISRAVVEAQSDRFASFRASTEEPLLERDEEQTAPPQLLRCTCPVLFRSHIAEGVCSCTCDWMETSRRRDCLSLSRGREHFGLRDRVCIERGECNKPACASGSYDAVNGKCPHRFKRQSRRRSRYQSLRHG